VNRLLHAAVSVATGAAVALGGAAAADAAAGSASSHQPSHHDTVTPLTVDAVTVNLKATRSRPATATRCLNAQGIIQIDVSLAGKAASADDRLAGDLTLNTHVLFAIGKGIGNSTGDIVIKDPATGRVKVRASLIQLETQGAAKFDGVLMGTVYTLDNQRVQLTALYSGQVDVDAGTLIGNIGADTPIAPHDSGVVVTGTCQKAS
jgi:hypothetical protein